MSDSSEDEDLSRFKEAVDISFLNIINKTWIELKNHIKNGTLIICYQKMEMTLKLLYKYSRQTFRCSVPRRIRTLQ